MGFGDRFQITDGLFVLKRDVMFDVMFILMMMF